MRRPPTGFHGEWAGKPLADTRKEPSMSSLVLEAQNGSPAKRHGKARILVVDDYPDARTLLAIALNRRGGYEVTTAGSAEEALRLIDTRFVRTTDEGSRVLDLELLI